MKKSSVYIGDIIVMTRPLFSEFVVVIIDLHISDLVLHYHDSYGYTEIVVFIFKVNNYAFRKVKFALFVNFRINAIFLRYTYIYIGL